MYKRQRLGRVLLAGKGFTSREMKHTFPLIAKDFKSIPVTLSLIHIYMCIRDSWNTKPTVWLR